MAIFSRLLDLYSFPGLSPVATVRGVFGDPYAIVIALRRRRKKHLAASVAPFIAPSTIIPSDRCAISIAVDDVSISNSPSAVSTVGTATP